MVFDGFETQEPESTAHFGFPGFQQQTHTEHIQHRNPVTMVAGEPSTCKQVNQQETHSREADIRCILKHTHAKHFRDDDHDDDPWVL